MVLPAARFPTERKLRAQVAEIEIPRQHWLPREKVAPDRWISQNVYLSGKVGAHVPGYFSFASHPYSRGVLEAFADPDVEIMLMSWGTQLGKTTNLNSLVCWVAENDPAATMIGVPTEQAGISHYRTKLEPFLESVDAIRQRMLPRSARSWKLVDLGFNWVWYAWPGSTITISDRSIRYLFINEANLHQTPEGTEGDPLQMLLDRTKGFPFPGRKIVIEGKPTVAGECVLERWGELAQIRRYHIPCPRCGHYQVLAKASKDGPGICWDRTDHRDEAPELARRTARWRCAGCAADIGEDQKLYACHQGVWVADGQTIAKDRQISGTPTRHKRTTLLHLPSFYSAVATWGDFAARWEQTRHDPPELRAVVNGWLAETWKRKKVRTAEDALREHLQPYKLGTVPRGAVYVVMTIDTQETCLYYVLRAWGYLANSWLVKYGQCESFAQAREIADTAIEGEPDADGEIPLHRADLVLVDSTYRSNDVYQFVASLPNRGVAVRAEHQYRQISLLKTGRIEGFDIPFWNADAGQVRDQLFETRLNIPPGTPGFWALPADVRRDYLRSLAAWQHHDELDAKKGLMRRVWSSTSAQYEHLADCECLQELAAFHYRFADLQRPVRSAVERPMGSDSAGGVGHRPDGRPFVASQR